MSEDLPNYRRNIPLSETSFPSKKKFKSTRYRTLIARAKATSPLLLLSGVSQLIIGLVIVFLSVLGLITPIWVASILSVLGSITTMVGFFICYEIFSTSNQMNSLHKEAIKRILESQN